jgi:hypothetical protein
MKVLTKPVLLYVVPRNAIRLQVRYFTQHKKQSHQLHNGRGKWYKRFAGRKDFAGEKERTSITHH